MENKNPKKVDEATITALFGFTFLSGCTPYDFIFCRNLLIYFDRATQAAALRALTTLKRTT